MGNGRQRERLKGAGERLRGKRLLKRRKTKEDAGGLERERERVK